MFCGRTAIQAHLLVLLPIFLFCAADSRTLQNKISEYLINMTDRGAINNDDDDDDVTIEWGWGDDEGRKGDGVMEEGTNQT